MAPIQLQREHLYNKITECLHHPREPSGWAFWCFTQRALGPFPLHFSALTGRAMETFRQDTQTQEPRGPGLGNLSLLC